MSWSEKILRVDLGAGTCTSEPLNMEWAQDYMGPVSYTHLTLPTNREV